MSHEKHKIRGFRCLTKWALSIHNTVLYTNSFYSIFLISTFTARPDDIIFRKPEATFFFIISGVRYTGTTDLHLPPFYFEETHKVQEAVASDKFKSDIIC